MSMGASTLIGALVLFACAFAMPMHGDQKSPPDGDLFCGGQIPAFRIELAESASAMLNRNERNYVRADVTGDRSLYHAVGLRLKGMGSFQPLSQRPNLVVKFNQFVPAQRYHGLKKFMLNNSVQDTTMLAEWVASRVFHEASLPAPRVTHAFVELNGRNLGPYVLVEGTTSDFLKDHFKSGRGNLYEGYLQDIDQQLDQDGGRDSSQSDLKQLLEVCRIQDVAQRWRRSAQR
jgi:spore coat protein CotH